MPHVEMLGAPGAGKSTITRALVESWAGAVDLDRAVHDAVAARGRNGISRVTARLVGPDTRLWKSFYARSTDRAAALDRFRASHPQLVEAVNESQRNRSGRDRGQDLVLTWVHGLFARYQLASESGPRRLVIDEGFAQRAVAVFGFGFDHADEADLIRYQEASPRPQTLILVNTPLEMCSTRLDARDWSQRVRDLPAADRQRFLADSNRVVNRVTEIVKGLGVPVVVVDGSAPVENVIPDLVLALSD